MGRTVRVVGMQVNERIGDLTVGDVLIFQISSKEEHDFAREIVGLYKPECEVRFRFGKRL